MGFVLDALAAACTAALVWFGTGLHPWWPLMWLAPIPALIVATRSTWLRTFVVTFAGFYLGNLNLWHFLHDVLSTPVFVLLLEFSVQALAFALVILLFRALYRRHRWMSALVGFPAAWVSIEYLISLIWVHGTAGNLAYTQLDNLPILQIAAFTGPWGISFALLLFSAALVIFPRAPRVASGGLAAVIVALILGGTRKPPTGTSVKVGLVASDLPANTGVVAEGPRTLQLLRDYATAAQGLHARVIVLPEKIGVLVDADTVAADEIFQTMADKDSAQIVMGVVRVADHTRYNQARIYSPRSPVRTYDKQHMLPPYESKLTPGSSLTLVGPLGVAICKDMDFIAPSREYGEAGIGALLVPAWDFDLDRFSHGHMAIMRGVEEGFSIARAAKQGYLTVSDDRGRVVAEARSDAAPFSTLVADLPVAHETTIYRKYGDWFAWLMLAVCGLAIFDAVHTMRRHADTF